MRSGSDKARVLLVATTAEAMAALSEALARAAIAQDAEVETDVDRALARIVSDGYELVIVDHDLPGIGGIPLIAAARERGATAPLVLFCRAPDEDVERAAIDAGVTEVLYGDDLDRSRLIRRIRLAVRIGRADAEAAQMLSQAQQAAAARDELLAIVSHDLRSPLNAIVLACDALDGDVSDTERRRYVAAIRRSGQRAERLLRDLLDVSKIESGKIRLERRAVSARAILEQARSDHEILARDAGSPLQVEITAEPGQILADRDRILQVLANLVSNALKHAAGAPIVLQARGAPNAVELEVADRGPGIAAEALPNIFDRFWQGRTRRRGGGGLGLTIAKGIIDAHAGTITVDSQLGQGTRFVIRLPRP
jgi:signal transduction histidine kinase